MRRRDSVLAVLATALVTGIVALMLLDVSAGHRRDVARAQIQLPPVVTAMSALLEDDEGPAGDSEWAAEVGRVRESTTAYARLFQMAKYTEDDPEWNELLEKMAEPESEWEEGLIERLAAYLQRNQPVLNEIRRVAALDGPVRAFSVEQVWADMESHGRIRHYARLLHADARVAAMTSDFDRATSDIVATIQLGGALAAEPTVISHLVRFALQGFVNSATDFVPPTGLPTEYHARLQTALAQTYHRDAFTMCFAVEPLYVEEFFSQPSPELGLSLFDSRLTLFDRLYGSPLGRPLRHHDEAEILGILVDLQPLVNRPYYDIQPELENVFSRERWMPRPYTTMVSYTLESFIQAQARHEAWVGLAQLGLAIERFRDETGGWPPNLDAAAHLLPAETVPLDPFSGSSYVYRPGDDTFVLYSIGVNQIDDDGQTTATFHNGDLFWRAD